MTLTELLEGVKKRFTPLLVTEKATLEAFLRQALAAYQSRAGHVQRVLIQKEAGESLPYPDDYLALVGAVDKRGRLVYSDDYGTGVVFDFVGGELFPVTLSYFLNLRERPLTGWEVPPIVCPLIEDYLEALIAIKNSERQRRVSIAGKLDTSGIPDEVTLYQRKTDIEAEMSARRAVISTGFTITGG